MLRLNSFTEKSFIKQLVLLKFLAKKESTSIYTRELWAVSIYQVEDKLIKAFDGEFHADEPVRGDCGEL